MIKILKQQTATSYPVYYCETSADLQKLSTFAPVGSIAYENGKQYILNSLREFAALEYSVNLDDIQLPPDVKEYWESSSLGDILILIADGIFELYNRCNNLAENSGNQLLIETVGKGNDNDSTIISGMSKAAFVSKIKAGKFVDIKVVSKILDSNGAEYLRPQVYSVKPGINSFEISVKYDENEIYNFNILTIEGWVED